jgi:hypothetical protein
MVNPTYKHLDAKMRLGGLRLVQWLQLMGATGFALVFGFYVSPFPPGPTIAFSVFVAGLPVAVSFAALGLEFSVSEFAAAAWRWSRSPRRYVPGPGQCTIGYAVHPQLDPPTSDLTPNGVAATSRIAELWD